MPAILRRLGELDQSEHKLPTTREELTAALRVNEKVTVGLVREAAGRIGEVVAKTRDTTTSVTTTADAREPYSDVVVRPPPPLWSEGPGRIRPGPEVR